MKCDRLDTGLDLSDNGELKLYEYFYSTFSAYRDCIELRKTMRHVVALHHNGRQRERRFQPALQFFKPTSRQLIYQHVNGVFFRSTCANQFWTDNQTSTVAGRLYVSKKITTAPLIDHLLRTTSYAFITIVG